MQFCSQFMFVGTSDRPQCHASTIVELPSGDILGAWYAGTQEGLPDVAVMSARFSRDDCRWSDATVLFDTPGMPEGNPVLFVDPSGGLRLFFVTIVEDGWDGAQLKSTLSADEGRSWAEPVVLGESLGTMVRNKPLFLDDGRVILPLYDDPTYRSLMYLSDDGCQTWRRSGWISSPTGCVQPTLFRKTDGTIVALMRDGGHAQVWRSESRDRGETWSPAAGTFLRNPNAGVDLVHLDSGNLVLAFNDTRTSRTPLSLAWSDDEGDNWLVKLDVATGEGEYSYPAIIQDRYGTIHLAHTWRRTAIAHVMLDEEFLVEHGERRTLHQPLGG
jgi:predicted neuraminidase